MLSPQQSWRTSQKVWCNYINSPGQLIAIHRLLSSLSKNARIVDQNINLGEGLLDC